MLVLLSPAKTLDYHSEVPALPLTDPRFMSHSAALIRELRELSPSQLSELMSISTKLADLNAQRYQDWRRTPAEACTRAAILAFAGDVYDGLQAATFTAADHDYAQQHLRILSGLYGVLRPLDRLQAYRLEMGTRLATKKGTTLYDYWGDQLATSLMTELKDHALHPEPVVINLASQEYSKAALTPALTARVISPAFLDEKNGKYRTVGLFAKKARGQMAAWIVRERVAVPEKIKEFTGGGYAYSEAHSDGDTWAFIR